MGQFWQALGNIGTFFVGLAAITGVAGGVTAITAKARKLKIGDGLTHVLRALPKRFTATALTSILVGALLGALLVLAWSLRSQPCSPTNLSIISPTDGAVVNQSEPVLGTINHLCPGQHLWLVLQPGGPGGGGYYPQDEVAVAGSAERWSTSAYFGRASRSDDGRPFTLLAVLAGNSTNLQFQKYLASGAVTHDFPGLSDLGGATALGKINVIRGPYLPAT